MSEPKKRELKVSIVSYEEFSAYDYIPVAAYYFKNASGDFVCLHSSDRLECQSWTDENYSKNKYSVIPSKNSKPKSKLESGGLSCSGTSTRRGQSK
jgi:hypothetical protein